MRSRTSPQGKIVRAGGVAAIAVPGPLEAFGSGATGDLLPHGRHHRVRVVRASSATRLQMPNPVAVVEIDRAPGDEAEAGVRGCGVIQRSHQSRVEPRSVLTWMRTMASPADDPTKLTTEQLEAGLKPVARTSGRSW